jgi:hypothetical protein
LRSAIFSALVFFAVAIVFSNIIVIDSGENVPANCPEVQAVLFRDIDLDGHNLETVMSMKLETSPPLETRRSTLRRTMT